MVTCSKRFLHHSGFCFDRAYTACVTGMINDAVGGDCPSGDGDFQVNQDNTGTMSIDFRSQSRFHSIDMDSQKFIVF